MTWIFSLLSAAALLAAAVLAVAPGIVEAGGGGHGCLRGPSVDTGTTVTIAESCFGPTLLRVQPGTTVTFENHDFMPHNVFSSDNVALLRESDLQPGQQAAITVEQAGLLLYYCTLHPSMVGVIVAGDELSQTASVASAPVSSALAPKGDAAAEQVAKDDGRSLSVGAVAGIAVAVGLVSAGGGFALRRRG